MEALGRNELPNRDGSVGSTVIAEGISGGYRERDVRGHIEQRNRGAGGFIS